MSPALDHDIVDVLGTVLRPRQTLPLLVNLMQDLERVVQSEDKQSTQLFPPSLPPPLGRVELQAALPTP